MVRLWRAVALYRGFAPVPPDVQTAEVLFASGRADCGGSVWFGSYGLSPFTGACAPVPPDVQTAEVQFASGIFAKLF